MQHVSRISFDQISWTDVPGGEKNLGEIEVSVAVVEVRTLPRLLHLITDLRYTLTSSSEAQEDALDSLGEDGIGPELAKRMQALRNSASAETERRSMQRRGSFVGSSLDVTPSIFADIDELETEAFSEASYASRLVKLLCLAINVVVKELEAAKANQSLNPLLRAPPEEKEVAPDDSRVPVEALKACEGRVRDLEAQVEAMLEWNNEQGDALGAAQATIDFLRGLSMGVVGDAEERLTAVNRSLEESHGADRGKRAAERAEERRKLAVLATEGEAAALRVENSTLKDRLMELEAEAAHAADTAAEAERLREKEVAEAMAGARAATEAAAKGSSGKVTALEAEVEAAQAQAAKAENLLAVTEAKLAALDDNKTQIMSMVAELERVMQAQAAKLEAAEGVAAELSAAKASLAKLEDVQFRAESAENTLKESAEANAALAASVKELEAFKDGAVAAADDAKKELEEAQDMAMSLQDRVDELEAFEAEVADLKTQLEAATSRNSEASDAEKKALEEKVSALEAAAKAQAIEKASAPASVPLSEFEDLKKEMEEAQDMAVSLQDRVDELEAFEAEVADLKTQLEAVTSGNSAASDAEKKALEEKVSALEAAAKAQAANDAAAPATVPATEVESMKKELEEAQDMAVSLQERVDELEVLEGQLAEAKAALAAATAASEGSAKAASEELEEAQDMILALQGRIDELEGGEAT